MHSIFRVLFRIPSVSISFHFPSYNFPNIILVLQFHISFQSICWRQTGSLQCSLLYSILVSLSPWVQPHISLHTSIHPITSPSMLANPLFQAKVLSHAPSQLSSQDLISTSCVFQRKEKCVCHLKHLLWIAWRLMGAEASHN